MASLGKLAKVARSRALIVGELWAVLILEVLNLLAIFIMFTGLVADESVVASFLIRVSTGLAASAEDVASLGFILSMTMTIAGFLGLTIAFLIRGILNSRHFTAKFIWTIVFFEWSIWLPGGILGFAAIMEYYDLKDTLEDTLGKKKGTPTAANDNEEAFQGNLAAANDNELTQFEEAA